MSAAELKTLAEQLAEIGPNGWTLFAGGDVLRAERRGTHRYEQVATAPEGLLLAVQEAEARLEENEARVARAGVAVTEGVANTHTMRPLRAR